MFRCFRQNCQIAYFKQDYPDVKEQVVTCSKLVAHMNHFLYTTKVSGHRCAIVWKIYRGELVQYLLYDKHRIFLCLRNKIFCLLEEKVNQLQICQGKEIILGTSSIYLVWLQPSLILGDCQHPSDLNERSQGSCCVSSHKITLLSPWCACFQSPLLQATQHE